MIKRIIIYLAFLSFTFTYSYNKKEKPNTMELKKITPNFMVINLKETVDFYTNVLGFKIKSSSTEWTHLKKGDCEIMFQPAKSLLNEFPELLTTKTGGRLTLFIQMENVSEYYTQIKNKATIIRPLGVTKYNGATEFVIQDLNGNILHFSDIVFD
jgi:uncharacterized glyoxalase superfamily protein PhnB